MRAGGLTLVLERAIERTSAPIVRRFRAAIVLGALREDVCYLPGLGRPREHWSFSHFWGPDRPGGFLRWWPGAPGAAERRFTRAVARHRRGDAAGGCVELGRAAHLLIDMACPAHVHRVVHDTDGFEWYVETHGDELGALPVPPAPGARRPAELVEGLARFTHRFPADRTQHALGRALVRRRWARGLPQAEIRRAAAAIIPVAIAHVAALLTLYAGAVDG